MTATPIEDLAVLTGPLKLASEKKAAGNVDLVPGEVVHLLGPADVEGNIRVHGVVSQKEQLVDYHSLTPLGTIHDWPWVQWGDPNDPDYSTIHDYVYVEEDDQ